MPNALIALLIAAVCLGGCKKSSTPSPSAAKSGDAVQQKLQELAGAGAADCGRINSQAPDQLQPAANCAMQAAQSKHPFYVAYEMPGLTVAVAGDSAGTLHTVQSEPPVEGQAGATAQLQSTPCTASLRIAQSGRVTCMTPNAPGAMGSNPHGGMAMPSAEGENPHGGMRPSPGTPNPHGPSEKPKQKKQP